MATRTLQSVTLNSIRQKVLYRIARVWRSSRTLRSISSTSIANQENYAFGHVKKMKTHDDALLPSRGVWSYDSSSGRCRCSNTPVALYMINSSAKICYDSVYFWVPMPLRSARGLLFGKVCWKTSGQTLAFTIVGWCRLRCLWQALS